MTVEIKLVPDGGTQIPAELLDDSIVAHHLSQLSVPDDAPFESWIDIERSKSPPYSKIILRIRGIMLSDVSDALLTQVHESITKQVNGIKPNRKGWVEHDDSTDGLPANP